MQNITQPPEKTLSAIAYTSISLLAALCLWMVFFYDASGKQLFFPIKKYIPFYGSIFTGILLIIYSFTRDKQQYATRIYTIALAIILFATGAATMVSSAITRNVDFIHRHDTYHYLLGPKYYPELQYNRHYGCTAAADSESEKPALRPTSTMRNLVTYNYQPISRELARWKKDCPNYFGVRWEEFKQDIETYKKLGDLGYWMGDMGYNGTPFHAYVMGKIANLYPLTEQNIRRLTVIDMLLICSMIAAVIWAAGGHIGMLAGIYFFVYAGDQYRITGNAFGRYMWMSLLVIGLCFLIKRRFTFAGLCMAFSTMTALFPSLFFAGLGITGLREWIHKKRFPDNYELIVFGAVVAIITSIYLATSFADGYKNLLFYYDKIASHGQALTFKHTNLLYLFVERNYTAEDPFSILGSTHDIYNMLKPVIIVFALICIIISAVACWKYAVEPVDAAILMGFTLMFTATPIIGYYFSSSLLLLILLRHFLHHRSVLIGASLVYFSMAFMTWVFNHPEKGVDSYHLVMNGMLSYYILFVLAGIITMWATLMPRLPVQQQEHP